MSSRTYALAWIAMAASLFCTVVGINLVLDPQKIYRGGNLDHSPSTNDRYLRFKEYEAHAESCDGLLFGSSRGYAIPLDILSRYCGGVQFASFAVYGGMVTDHAPVLEHVLREKSAGGLRLRTVFLLLDVEKLGDRPLTNQILQYTWPPAITGESPARFWWSNLTAIQPEAWKERLRRGEKVAQPTITSVAAPASFSGLASVALIGTSAPAMSGPPNRAPQSSSSKPAQSLRRPTQERYFSEHWLNLQRIVALCREHHVQLIIALSPLQHGVAASFDETDLARVVERVSSLAPLWDFNSSPLLADRTDLWLDASHFSPEIAKMMLAQIFVGTPQGANAIGVQRGN
jgi:hypothetical protein